MSQPRQEIQPRPATLLPLGPWFRWGWQGLFIPGHSANQFMRFCLVGASGVGVNTLVYWALVEGLDLNYVFSSICAFLVANFTNFLLNKVFTFANRDWSGARLVSQYLRFMGVSLVGLGINLVVLVALVELAGLWEVWANLAGVLVATVSNFLGSKFLAFSR
jgi:putative flippase GtrA